MTFYRENPTAIWVELDEHMHEKVDTILNKLVVNLTDDEWAPSSWQCSVRVHVSYAQECGQTGSEFYHSQLVLHQLHAKYPTLSRAPLGKDILSGWRQWFSGGNWRVSNFLLAMARGQVGRKPLKHARTKRDRSWRVGDVIPGDDFVKYLERLQPPSLKDKDLPETGQSSLTTSMQ